MRHFVDWHDNVFIDHDAPDLASRIKTSRSRPDWFDPGAHDELVAMRVREDLPPKSDLASEDSEDAITWSVFQALRRAARDWSWWERLGLDAPPAVAFWPRHEESRTEGADIYRRCGETVEPYHPSTRRSEIDVLLSTARHHLLVEAKWKSKPLGRQTELDSKISEHLARIAADLLAPDIDLDAVLEYGAYQALRHLLYCKEIARQANVRAELVYLVNGDCIGVRRDDPAELESYRDALFGPIFRPPYPRVVLWESLLASAPETVLDRPLAEGEFHHGATLRDYLAGRRLGGRPAPLASLRQARTDVDDPPLVLSGVCTSRLEDGRWKKKERGPWAISSPRAKLVEKYTRGTSAIFSHYVYRFPHPDPDRITSVDMEAADRLMSANISAQHERWRGIASSECQEQLAPVLRRIPVRASIEDPTFDADVGEAIEILTARDGVKLAIATKLLCIKRPYLIPMMDSVVQDCFGSNRALEILEGFRRLLAEQEVSQRVDALVDQLAAITGVIPSRVRILDELIWFDWNLRPPGEDGLCEVVGFPDWVYDPANDEHGVYRRPEP